MLDLCNSRIVHLFASIMINHVHLNLLVASRYPRQARSKVGAGRFPTLTQHTRLWHHHHHRGSNLRAQVWPHLTGLSVFHQVFHCVHFECPEQQSSQKEESSEEPGTGDPNTPGQQLDPHALRAPSASSLPPSPGPNSRSPNQQHQ